MDLSLGTGVVDEFMTETPAKIVEERSHAVRPSSDREEQREPTHAGGHERVRNAEDFLNNAPSADAPFKGKPSLQCPHCSFAATSPKRLQMHVVGCVEIGCSKHHRTFSELPRTLREWQENVRVRSVSDAVQVC